MIVNIPVSEHVKRFLKKEFGREPIYVRADSKLGRLFVLSFSHGVTNSGLTSADLDEIDEKDKTEPKTAITKQESKKVECQFNITFRIGRYNITPDSLLRMTNALDAEFEKALYYFCKGRRVFHNSESAAVKHFLMLYCIPEKDLPEETAIKMAQRERGARAQISA
jgi:hypothetical protein